MEMRAGELRAVSIQFRQARGSNLGYSVEAVEIQPYDLGFPGACGGGKYSMKEMPTFLFF